jgi:hypothetical protein
MCEVWNFRVERALYTLCRNMRRQNTSAEVQAFPLNENEDKPRCLAISPEKESCADGEIFRNAPSELIDKVGVVSDNGRFKESLREKSITES